MEPLESRSVVSDALLGALGSGLLADLALDAAPLGGTSPGLVSAPHAIRLEVHGQEETSMLTRMTLDALTEQSSSVGQAAPFSSREQRNTVSVPHFLDDFVLPRLGPANARSGRHDQSVGKDSLCSSPGSSSAANLGAVAPGSFAGGSGGAPAGPSGVAPARVDPLLMGAGTFQPAPAAVTAALNGSGGEPLRKGTFDVSWQAGTTDPNGQFMGGTEVTYLVPHQQKLFAGTGVLLDLVRTDPRLGAQILRLDSANDQWQVDHFFGDRLDNGQPRFVRVEMLQEVTFTTDDQGDPLPEPVSMLLASPSDKLGNAAVYSRDDATGTWTEMSLASSAPDAFIRSVGMHRDTVTGVDRIFAGISGVGIFSGVYDPSVPGRIRWDSQPELGPGERTMAFGDLNGSLCVVRKPEMDVRIDGVHPAWERVLSYPDPPPLYSGLRALTAIPNPDGPGQIFLASKEDGTAGTILRISSTPTYSMTVELDLGDFLQQRIGGVELYGVAGYNDMTTLVNPRTGETVQLIGLLIHPQAPSLKRSTWYLVRHADGQYDLHQILPQPAPTIPNPFLTGTRSIVVSPFPEDNGRVVYFGGFDVQVYPAHNTAWIYRASRATVLNNPVSVSPNRPEAIPI